MRPVSAISLGNHATYARSGLVKNVSFKRIGTQQFGCMIALTLNQWFCKAMKTKKWKKYIREGISLERRYINITIGAANLRLTAHIISRILYFLAISSSEMCRCGTTLSSFPTGVLTKNLYSTEPIIGRKIAQATLAQAIYRLGTPTAQRKRQAFHEKALCLFSDDARTFVQSLHGDK